MMTAPEATRPRVEGDDPAQRARILIIEDHPTNMILATDVLTAAGYQVLQAIDAESGMAVARAEHPSLILMDVSLPGTDGLSATRALRADPATSAIPIVALTAHAMKGDREKALAAGCVGYLTKPISVRELPAQVAGFLRTA
jgi:two-component system cell cycle response regulator DivK